MEAILKIINEHQFSIEDLFKINEVVDKNINDMKKIVEKKQYEEILDKILAECDDEKKNNEYRRILSKISFASSRSSWSPDSRENSNYHMKFDNVDIDFYFYGLDGEDFSLSIGNNMLFQSLDGDCDEDNCSGEICYCQERLRIIGIFDLKYLSLSELYEFLVALTGNNNLRIENRLANFIEIFESGKYEFNGKMGETNCVNCE